jgi:hypothetical protein
MKNFGGSLLLTLLAAVVVCGMFPASRAFAQPFTFTVPVKVSNLLPEVTAVEVQCLVYLNKVEGVDWSSNVGTGSKSLPVDAATGNLSSTFQVGVNLKPGLSPADAKWYVCYMNLVTPAGKGCGSVNAVLTYQKVKTGTPLNCGQSGWLPWKGP